MGRKANPNGTPERSGSAEGMEENLKKAVAEMLVLRLLREREMYIGEIPKELERRTNGVFRIVFPYSVMYRMQEFGYVEELHKRIAPDGRRRQYYKITEKGTAYVQSLQEVYRRFAASIATVMDSTGGETHAQSGSEAVYQSDPAVSDVPPEVEASADAGAGADDRAVPDGLPGCLV